MAGLKKFGAQTRSGAQGLAWVLGAVLGACGATPPSCPAPVPCPPCAASPGSVPEPVRSVALPPASSAPMASAAPVRRRPTAQLFEGDRPAPGFFPRGDAFALGVDGQALDALVEEAAQTRSDALLVLKDGQVIVERTFGARPGPIETMSVTKSITALAVMMLLEDGKIPSLDAPLGRWLPEFSRGKRASITLRHLLTHTSGLAHPRDPKPLNAQKDRSAFALQAEPEEEPGAVFSYNNRATQLLAPLIERAAGKPVDALLEERLFRPLGVRRWQWARDDARSPQTYYGLALEARDLARIGQLLLDGGSFQGRALLSPASIEKISTPSEKNVRYGLLWWLRYEREVQEPEGEALAGVPGLGAGALGGLLGRVYASPEVFWMEAGGKLTEGERGALARWVEGGGKALRSRPDRALGFSADGSLGQRLVVLPGQGLVAVRQRRRRPASEEAEALAFPAMAARVQALVLPGAR
ncbi:MAG: beta-lactamase family protein [Polyangiaceae bacterium]|nr:beta-lactamase family protein [Polyangiaceae bacterium]